MEHYWSLFKSLGNLALWSKTTWIRVCPLVGALLEDVLSWVHSPSSLTPIPLVDLNPCLFHICMPNFNRKQTALGYVFWMLGSVFFLTSFPLRHFVWTGTWEACLLGWRMRCLAGVGADIVPSGGILWELQISPYDLRGVWEVLAGLQGFSVTFQILYSKLITLKFIIYTGYLRDNMLGVLITWFVYHYKIWPQVTRNRLPAASVLFHHLPSMCMRGKEKRSSPTKGNWKESRNQELSRNSKDQKIWSQTILILSPHSDLSPDI